MLVQVDAIAARTPCTTIHVYELAKRRRIPHYRFEDGSVLFDPQEVKEWFDQMTGHSTSLCTQKCTGAMAAAHVVWLCSSLTT